MPRLVRSGSLALLLLVFAACGGSTGPAAPQTIDAARALWQSHHLATYTYLGTQECSCGAHSGIVTVDVTDGRVSAVTDMVTHTQVSTIGWLTIDQLFDLAETLQPRPIVFDSQYGYPKRVERCCTVDDSGAVYTVSSLST